MRIIRARNARSVAVMVAFLAAFALPLKLSAQSEESELPPARGEFEAAPLPPPAQPFFVPDVPESVLQQTQVRERWVTLKLGVAAVFDYTTFHQDAASISQVTKQEDKFQVR